MRQASINGRSLSQEITVRLVASVNEQSAPAHIKPTAGKGVDVANGLSLSAEQNQEAYGAGLTDMHRQVIALFSALTPDKQLALLTLLKR